MSDEVFRVGTILKNIETARVYRIISINDDITVLCEMNITKFNVLSVSCRKMVFSVSN